MRRKKEREATEINAGSMADIAFLLLIFFLVTTTIVSDSALPFTLPEKTDQPPVDVKINDKNIFKVIVNSSDKLLVEDDIMELAQIREEAIKFLENKGRDKDLSDSPKDAIVSYRADRGTSYEMFINVLDELKAAYHVVRAKELGISLDAYLALDKEDKADKKLLDKAKEAYPMQLSIAEPSKF
ncbi:MAG: biopolymer transporter ExbD [Cytophagales bacterium]|nr:biopolymer transporter ExbD [Cytophagales bacterium]